MATEQFKPDGIQFTPTVHADTYPFITPSNQNLSNRHIFITGASKGIGRAMALGYAAAGASHIAISARSPPTSIIPEMEAAAKSASRQPPTILPLAMDVTSPESIASAAKEISSKFGHLDVLINNAGYLEDFIPITESDADEWWKTMTVNLRGPYLASKAFVPLLLSAPSGALKTVVNVSSVGALRVRPGASGYQSSKFALLRLTEFLCAEYGEKGLLALAIHPGGVMTELASKMPKHTHHLLQDKPELGGNTTVWLTSKRREWLAGRYVSVNWDMEELEKEKGRIVEGDLLKMRLAV